MDSISYSLEKANGSKLGKLSFEDLWSLNDDEQTQLFLDCIMSLDIKSSKTVILGKSFNKHHYAKGFMAEELSLLEDTSRSLKFFIQENFIMNYAVFTPVENGIEVKIITRENIKTFVKSN